MAATIYYRGTFPFPIQPLTLPVLPPLRYVARQPRRRTWNLIKTIVFLIAVACAGWLLFQQTVQSQLSHKVQARVDQALLGSDITAKVRHATFIEGQGLELRNVSVGTRIANSSASAITTANPLVEIYEAFVRSPVSMAQLVTGDMPIRSVEIRRARLNLTKDSSGNWNFRNVIQQLQKLKTPGSATIPLMLQDCQIELVDQSDPSRQRNIRVSNLKLSVMPVEHQGRQLTQVSGQFACSEVSDVHFTAWVDPANGQWKVDLDARDLRFSRDSLLLLPDSLAAQLEPLRRLDGRISLNGTVSGDTGLIETPQIEINGNCRSLAISDSRLPWRIEDTSFQFQLSNAGFSIDSAKGSVGKGNFQLSYGQAGWLNRTQWYANGNVQGFHHRPDRRLASILPSYCDKFCRDFKPEGTCNLEFDMVHDGRELKRVVNAELTDMAFTFIGLPYKISHCEGVANIVNRDCRFQVRATEDDQPIDIKGSINKMGGGATFTCDIQIPGALPIDEKMIRAIRPIPKLASVITAFNPIGMVGGLGRLERKVTGGPVHKSLDVQLKDIDIRHNSFSYPIRKVSGLVQTRDDQYTFSQLVGHNGDGQVSCDGTWNPAQGLVANLVCSRVPLDDQLRVALKPSLREIWHGFRPRGTVDQMLVELRLPIGQAECDVTVEAHLAKGGTAAVTGSTSIHPTWFPYEIQDLSGVIKIGDGLVALSDIEGHHDRSWIRCNGDGQYSNDAWSVRLKDMLVLSLSVDDDLIDAVPESLAPQVRNLQYDGKVNAQGEMTLAGRYDTTTNDDDVAPLAASPTSLSSSTFSLAWDVRLDMTGADMMIGVPVTDVFGAVKLVGQYDGYHAECRGELDIDSLMIYDNQVTNVEGPIWLDNDRAAAGLFAEKTPTPESPALTAEASPLPAKQQRSLQGNLHEGVVHFDALINSAELGEFYLQSTLSDGKLEATCRELCPSMTDIAGRTFAAVRLAGNCSGTHTYRGDGTVQLRDAAIYELPPVLDLLKKLRIGRSNRSAFDSSNISFTISGETFDLNRIELLGDAISLLGNGRLDMDRKIDLNFYSIMGRNRFRIPVVSELVHAGSQQAMWIRVNGTVDAPKMSRTVLPQLNDSLRQLFQPTTAGNAGPQRVAISGSPTVPGRPTYAAQSTANKNGTTRLR